jgi:hypothetical protein
MGLDPRHALDSVLSPLRRSWNDQYRAGKSGAQAARVVAIDAVARSRHQPSSAHRFRDACRPITPENYISDSTRLRNGGRRVHVRGVNRCAPFGNGATSFGATAAAMRLFLWPLLSSNVSGRSPSAAIVGDFAPPRSLVTPTLVEGRSARWR